MYEKHLIGKIVQNMYRIDEMGIFIEAESSFCNYRF